MFKNIAASIVILGMSSVAMAASSHHATPQHQFNYFAYGLGSYNYLQQSNQFTSGQHNRGNDIAQNGLRLNQVYLSINNTPVKRGWGGYADVVIGEEAIAIAPDGWNPRVFNLKNFGVTFPETYLLYRYNTFTLTFGHMLGFPGLESFNFSEDSNFSRSILDGNAQPGSHIGVRMAQQLSNHWTLKAGIGNGWNTIKQPGRIRLLEAASEYAVDDWFNIMLSLNVLDQGLTDNVYAGPTSRRYIVDMFGSYRLSTNLQLAWNLDYAAQAKAALPFDVVGQATWAGVDVYLNYQLNEQWRTSLRAEVFDDSDGYRTGVRQVWKEFTLTAGYQIDKHLEILAEVRRDFSNQVSFVKKRGSGARDYQQSFALAAYYKTA